MFFLDTLGAKTKSADEEYWDAWAEFMNIIVGTEVLCLLLLVAILFGMRYCFQR